ncbi:MAG: hypothetical protein A2Z13_07025 [Deltaproteobacteria bacterium RBG_16_64_85]|nr:MAG: hypothetical protein A2Z13_07025 [Deltaproteobacteria bacterium RBG_16_64_85]
MEGTSSEPAADEQEEKPAGMRASGGRGGKTLEYLRQEEAMTADWMPLVLIAVVFAVYFLAGRGGG